MQMLFLANKLYSEGNHSVGPCDVTSKESLEELVAKISKKEKHINLLS